MKEHIFRMYDIRGVVEEDFPEAVVTDLGRAYGTPRMSYMRNICSFLRLVPWPTTFITSCRPKQGRDH